MGLTGVRALFLYPLNALIKSQRDRLTAWSEPFGGHIRYCLYNGDTPREGKSVVGKRSLRPQDLTGQPAANPGHQCYDAGIYAGAR